MTEAPAVRFATTREEYLPAVRHAIVREAVTALAGGDVLLHGLDAVLATRGDFDMVLATLIAHTRHLANLSDTDVDLEVAWKRYWITLDGLLGDEEPSP